MSLLEARGVVVRYGGVAAVAGVDLAVESGEIVAIIGPNGAGKTTLLDALSGLVPVASGSITLDGRDIAREPAFRRAQLGLARTLQGAELFSSLRVGDHLRLSASLGSLVERSSPAADAHDRVHAVARFAGLDRALADPVRALGSGARRRLDIAMAILLRARCLLLDEPAGGADADDARLLRRMLLDLRVDFDLGIVLVEHDTGIVADVADSVVVLDFGRVIADGAPQEVLRDPRVLEAYLGTPVAAVPPGEVGDAAR